MKYGFITIIYNHNFYDKLFKKIFDNENLGENADIIILFDDELEQIVVEISSIINTPNIILRPDINFKTPFMIEKNSTLHMKTRGKKIDFLPIFKSYISKEEYNRNNDPSIYNCQYYKLDKYENKQYTFALMKKKYGFDSCRYLFSYDSNEFTKEEIQYIINNIFRYKN